LGAVIGRVCVFNRGRDRAELPNSVERLIGDRSGDLHAIANRDWDAVIDDATYGPVWVRRLGETLRGRAKHYTFISTISVYDTSAGSDPRDEGSPVLAYHGRDDPYSVTTQGPDYGALKVLCELEADRQFPGRTLTLRLGSVVDPLHQDEAVTYWPVRIVQSGGEMMAAGDPSWPIQFIDVRDLANWTIQLLERRVTGIYNTVGPASAMTLGQMIKAAHSNASASPRITWVSAPWLVARNSAQTWNVLLFWYGTRQIMRMNISRALHEGFATRPDPTRQRHNEGCSEVASK
jgi:2'-hydroxyisoflavone reductase